MSAEKPANQPAEDDSLAKLLGQFDDALRGNGTLPVLKQSSDIPENTPPEVARAMACLQLLEEVWPRQTPSKPERKILRTLGRFEVIRELGRGGFGTVYLAMDPTLGREVALKIPHPEQMNNPEVRARFQQEARAAAGLDHSHIVQVFETGKVGDTIYIALAYCPCVTLAEWFRRQTEPISFRESAGLIATLAEAVHYAHEHNVIHRDLKPANVLLTLTGGSTLSTIGDHDTPIQSTAPLSDFTAKITDFGLAKQLDHSMNETKSGAIVGTPNYMAPEQTGIRGERAGPASDIYSLGAILYELLSGRPPFVGDNALDTLHQVRFREPIPPRKLRPTIPQDVETICLKCLEKDPKKRYASGLSLAEDLRLFLHHKPILARPLGPVGRFMKWAKRKPAEAALIAVIGLAAVAIVAVLLWNDLTLRKQKEAAESARTQAVEARQIAETAQAKTAEALHAEVTAKKEQAVALERERRSAYQYRIRLAQTAIEQELFTTAQQYLVECAPAAELDYRDWEWHHLKRRCALQPPTYRRHTEAVRELVYSADGKWIASVSADETLQVYEAATGRVAHRFSAPKTAGELPRSLDFRPDGKQLAQGKGTTNAVILHPLDGAKPLPELRGNMPCFLGDGKQVATIDVPAGIGRIYSSDTGRELSSFPLPKGYVLGIAYAADAIRVVTEMPDRTIGVWNTISESIESRIRPPGNRLSTAIGSKGTYFAGSYDDGTVRIWSLANGREVCKITGHDGQIRAIGFAHDEKLLATADVFGNLRIHDLQGWELRFIRGVGKPIDALGFSPDQSTLCAIDSKQLTRLHFVQQDPEVLSARLLGVTVRGIAFHPWGDRAVVTSVDGRILVVDSTKWEIRLDLGKQFGTVGMAQFTPDGQRIIIARQTSTVLSWNATTGELGKSLKGSSAKHLRTVISPCGKLVATFGNDSAVVIHDAESDGVVARLHGLKEVVWAIQFSGPFHN